MSNVLDHATSEVHKAAMVRLQVDSVKASGGSVVLTSAIGRCMSTLDRDTRVRMERKFELCFVMAKESIPFIKYPAIMQLEERQGVDLGHAYRTLSHSLVSLLQVSARASLIQLVAEATSLAC